MIVLIEDRFFVGLNIAQLIFLLLQSNSSGPFTQDPLFLGFKIIDLSSVKLSIAFHLSLLLLIPIILFHFTDKLYYAEGRGNSRADLRPVFGRCPRWFIFFKNLFDQKQCKCAMNIEATWNPIAMSRLALHAATWNC